MAAAFRGAGTVKEGERIFAETCAVCHGPNGEGKPMDRLVGGRGTLTTATPVKTVGSYWPYATMLIRLCAPRYAFLGTAISKLGSNLCGKRVYPVPQWHCAGKRGDECDEFAEGGDAKSERLHQSKSTAERGARTLSKEASPKMNYLMLDVTSRHLIERFAAQRFGESPGATAVPMSVFLPTKNLTTKLMI
jgi:hypothetical protein